MAGERQCPSLRIQKETLPLASKRTQGPAGLLSVPGPSMPRLCLLGLHTHFLHRSVSSCSVLECGEQARVFELGREVGVADASLAWTWVRLSSVSFAPRPKADPGRDSHTPALHPPPTPASGAIVGLGGTAIASACLAVPRVLLLNPDQALSLVGRMEGNCSVPVALASSPHSVVLWGFPVPQTEHSRPCPIARWLDYCLALPGPSMLESKIAFPSIFVKMAIKRN